MYGNTGPPKGYSVPRYDTHTKKHCQLCSSAEHWTFECPRKKSVQSAGDNTAKKSGVKTAKLSRSQMLKYNIKPKPVNFVPEPTEREVFDAELKELRTVLTAEVRNELKTDAAAAAAAAAAATAAPASAGKTTTASATQEVSKSEELDPTAVLKEEPTPDASAVTIVKKEHSEEYH